MYRTHTCNDLTEKNIWEKVTLSWWVYHRRDHGDLVFVDLRDRYWITQVSFDPSEHPQAHKLAHSLRSEFVITVTWIVRKRPEWQDNTKLKTWNIEVLISELKIQNKSKTPPFELDQNKNVNEELRLKYRYLDLRRDKMRRNLIFRSKLTKFVRDFYEENWFLDVETPVMIKWTPEWSREYLVPSRIYPWTFFVLPQSPQQLKQLLMVAWIDKYFQIAKCFRDEDLRWDRQPEFTQIDIEMSFVEQEDIIDLHEKLFIEMSKKFAPEKELLFKPFKRITWEEAMTKYWSDKPDLRFDLEIKDVSEIVQNCWFKVFSWPAKEEDGCVKALLVPWGDKFTRKEIDELTKYAQDNWAKGLAYIQVRQEWPTGPVAKFLTKEELNWIVEAVWANVWDIIFFWADKFLKVCDALWAVRLKVAEMLWLRDNNKLAFVWVTDFPAFEKNEQWQIVSVHHPFTKPFNDDLVQHEDWDLTKIRSHAYDLALNGYELWGGSIRIHERDLQKKMFELMKIWEEEQKMKFWHLLEAFEYWAPPHWWIAFWLDRILMLFLDEPNIREVIPFPKDQKSKDLMLWAPSQMPDEQLDELGLERKEEVEI